MSWARVTSTLASFHDGEEVHACILPQGKPEVVARTERAGVRWGARRARNGPERGPHRWAQALAARSAALTWKSRFSRPRFGVEIQRNRSDTSSTPPARPRPKPGGAGCYTLTGDKASITLAFEAATIGEDNLLVDADTYGGAVAHATVRE